MNAALARLLCSLRRARATRQRRQIAAARQRLAELRENAGAVITAQVQLVAELEGRFLGAVRAPLTARAIAHAVERREKARVLA